MNINKIQRDQILMCVYEYNYTNSQISYFQKSPRPTGDPYRSNHLQQGTPGENNETAEFKKRSESKQSYLKAFKKYYIEKLLDKKLGSSDVKVHNDKENIFFFLRSSQSVPNVIKGIELCLKHYLLNRIDYQNDDSFFREIVQKFINDLLKMNDKQEKINRLTRKLWKNDAI